MFHGPLAPAPHATAWPSCAAFAAGLLLITACATNSTDGPVEVSAVVDAVGTIDAGGSADAGNSPDAGSSVDTETAPDGGSSDDSGSPVDASISVDSGSPSDVDPRAPDSGNADAGSASCVATAEICDGVDNDCDGQTDEVSCDDGKPCTKDACDGKNDCQNLPLNNEPCDADGSLCTTDDRCQGGVCIAGAKVNCNDGNGCTDDSCAPSSGCVHLANAATCSDGDGCTLADQCSSTSCFPGGVKPCDDGNTCTTDSCLSATGSCVHNSDSGTSGKACDADGSACTSGDVCAFGKCVAGPQVSCDDQNPCTVDSCDVAKGCVAKPVADKTACASDGQSWCMAGKCLAKVSCGPGFDPLPIDVDGAIQTACVALAPVWGQRPEKPVGVYTVKTLAGDNVVEDSQTKLMWQQKQAADLMVWADAAAYCDTLSYAGFKDWRLPSSHEISTLVDYTIAQPGPTTDLAAFPGTTSGHYWSSTLKLGAPAYAWRGNFFVGRINVTGGSSAFNVRCVRGTAPQPPTERYEISVAGGVVTDTWTKLQWQRAVTAGPHTWAKAKSYCDTLSLEGGGWRLPSVRELHGVTDPRLANPALDTKAFPNTPNEWFWASTPLAGSPTDVWYGNFNNGAIGTYGADVPYEVRCVRSP
jgi:hypothetical protein